MKITKGGDVHDSIIYSALFKFVGMIHSHDLSFTRAWLVSGETHFFPYPSAWGSAVESHPYSVHCMCACDAFGSHRAIENHTPTTSVWVFPFSPSSTHTITMSVSFLLLSRTFSVFVMRVLLALWELEVVFSWGSSFLLSPVSYVWLPVLHDMRNGGGKCLRWKPSRSDGVWCLSPGYGTWVWLLDPCHISLASQRSDASERKTQTC